jgi:hypothetical protein
MDRRAGRSLQGDCTSIGTFGDGKWKFQYNSVSQFPKGEQNLDWMKERDGQWGQEIGVTYAESFKTVDVW